ncbi:MAG: ABC-type bacteriocin/lantibiotic exporter with double-glycine peptidase domain [Flavobacteriales bacterium]|jgi:ABC-type bacteriocin/lantibiotic exporter with double-glycine peptidase domain
MDNSELTPLKRFWLLLKPDKKEIRNVYVYAVFYGLVNLSLPIGIQAIINLIQGGQMSTSWIILVVFVILGIAISGILQVSQLKITEHLQQKIFTRAAFEFAYRIPKIKLEAMYKHYAPELMNRFFDVISIQKGLSKILIDFSTASIQTFFGLILLSLYHPFFIVFSLILIILIYSIFKLTTKRGLETSLKESKSKYDVAHWLEELARTSVSFKLAGVTDLPLERTDESVKSYISARESHFKILVSQYSLMILFKVLVAAGLLIVGSILVMEQQMNIGQFVAAELIILLVLGSVEKLILCLESIYDVLTALEKVGQVTDLELELNTGMDITEKINNQPLSVELSKVNFSYPGEKRLIFKDASLKINARDRVMIMGDSDSGKTTLLYLFAALYKVQSGSISYNNLPMGNLNPNLLRSVIGDCLMDELLFEGTILENITMGRENATFDNVAWAIDNLGLTDFIKSLPSGYDTEIYPQGKQFAKGIVDKLIMARSIADKPRLLLIKDAFTSLVGSERERIMNFLTAPENPWTLIISSRDQSLKPKMNRVVVADNNVLTEITQ